LNTGAETLAFRIGNHAYPVYQLTWAGQHAEKGSVSREDFALAITFIKRQCTTAAKLLIAKLTQRFLDRVEALEIVFPQYWLQAHCDKFFFCHLVIIKQW
jgi:hypothetical protein